MEKVWLAKWVESANEVHMDMVTGKSGEGAASLQGSVTMDTGSRGLAALKRNVWMFDEATPTSTSSTYAGEGGVGPRK
jgi:hypothetical protein